MNRWIISVWGLFTHGLRTNEKERGRFVGLFLLCWDYFCPCFCIPFVYYCPCFCIPFIQDGPCAWSSSAGFSRNLAGVRITCGKAAPKKKKKALILQLSPGQGPFIFKLLIKGRAHHRQPPPTSLTSLTVKLDPSHLPWLCLWCSSRA